MASSSLPTTEVERESQTEPNWLELPKDITQNILQRLSTVEIITSACQVCPLWCNICKDPLMWRTIRMSRVRLSFSHSRYYYDADLVKICHNAVERSCGQLEDIDIEYFATDDLLEFIANCASHLCRIRLYSCDSLSDKGFSEAVKKLPLLVELDLSGRSKLSKDTFEVVGCFCPLLKTLKYGKICPIDGNIKRNEEVFVIVETMPGLCHLKISGNVITEEELLAILNGCHFLESLDLLECHRSYLNLNLNGSLRKRCYDQIKDFRPPLLQLQVYGYDDDDNDSDYDTGYINYYQYDYDTDGGFYQYGYEDDYY